MNNEYLQKEIELLITSRQYDEAISSLDRAIKAAPGDMEALIFSVVNYANYYKARVFALMEERQHMLDALEKAVGCLANFEDWARENDVVQRYHRFPQTGLRFSWL